MTVNNNFKPIITYMLLVDNPLVNNKIVTKEAKHNGYVWIGKMCIRDSTTGLWETRFRGFI